MAVAVAPAVVPGAARVAASAPVPEAGAAAAVMAVAPAVVPEAARVAASVPVVASAVERVVEQA
jgi:hypothetical protein